LQLLAIGQRKGGVGRPCKTRTLTCDICEQTERSLITQKYKLRVASHCSQARTVLRILDLSKGLSEEHQRFSEKHCGLHVEEAVAKIVIWRQVRAPSGDHQVGRLVIAQIAQFLFAEQSPRGILPPPME
jgi:hypothetical protein